jgi:ubiquitin-protein ligase
MSEYINLTKDTIKRLIKDIKYLNKNPLHDNGIYYSHDSEDMLKGYALIIGPSDTPYFGGYYFFDFSYPPDYPHTPPIVTYCTNGENIRFNPNLYTSGKVCISLLNTWRGEQWTSCQTISTILLTLCSLLNDTPLLNEPGITEKHNDYDKYNTIINYKNYDIAILQNIQNILNENIHFDARFRIFEEPMIESLKKNKNKIMKHLEHQKKNIKSQNISTGLYSMHVRINYTELYNNFSKLFKQMKIK